MIRDRGKLKWQPAFFMPEHVAMLKGLYIEEQKIQKPILDEHKVEEMDEAIHIAMEFALKVKIRMWDKGFSKDYSGLINRLDEINKNLYLDNAGIIVRFSFDNIVGVEIENRDGQ